MLGREKMIKHSFHRQETDPGVPGSSSHRSEACDFGVRPWHGPHHHPCPAWGGDQDHPLRQPGWVPGAEQGRTLRKPVASLPASHRRGRGGRGTPHMSACSRRLLGAWWDRGLRGPLLWQSRACVSVRSTREPGPLRRRPHCSVFCLPGRTQRAFGKEGGRPTLDRCRGPLREVWGEGFNPSPLPLEGAPEVASPHLPTDVILGFLQPEPMVEGELYPCVLPGTEPPCEEQIPGVAVGEARALHVAAACHLDGLVSSVQVCEVIALC